MKLQWSPGDLGRQRRAVRVIALRAERHQWRLHTARDRCVTALTRTLGSPLGLAGCFLAGFLVGAAPWRRRSHHANGANERARHRTNPLSALLAAAFWLRRRHTQFKALEEAARPSPTGPVPYPDKRAINPTGEYIH